MAPETEFSFAALSAPMQRHIRLFQAHQFLDRFAMGLTVSVVALALTDRGLDLSQIAVLFGIYAATTLLAELPFGGLADMIGRKPVFLAAVLSSVISIVVFLSSSNVYVLGLSFVFIGFGRALRSGTLDAWFVETFKRGAPRVEVQPALARAQWANALGLGFGAICGGVLPDGVAAMAGQLGISIYDVSYLASLMVMIGVFAFTLIAIDEAPRPKPLPRKRTSVLHVVKEALLLAATHPALSLLMAVLALFLMATNPVEVLWPTQVKPMLETGFANSAIGLLTAGYFLSIAVGAWLSVPINRIFGGRPAMTLAVMLACLAGLQIALAVQGGIAGFVGVFVLFSVALGVVETPASSLLHGCVDDSQRSTLLSLRSLVQQLGALLGLLVAGALAEIYSTSLAWGAGALALCLAAGLAWRLAWRSGATDTP